MEFPDLESFWISDVRVTFGFYGFENDPAEITDLLGIEPDEIRSKGEEKRLEDGNTVLVPKNRWYVSTPHFSPDVNDHFRFIFRRLRPVEEQVQSIKGAFFSVYWEINHMQGGNGPFYKPDVLSYVAKLGAVLFHDIYDADGKATEDKAFGRPFYVPEEFISEKPLSQCFLKLFLRDGRVIEGVGVDANRIIYGVMVPFNVKGSANPIDFTPDDIVKVEEISGIVPDGFKVI